MLELVLGPSGSGMRQAAGLSVVQDAVTCMCTEFFFYTRDVKIFSQESGRYKENLQLATQKRAHSRTVPSWQPDLELPASRTVSLFSHCCLNPPVCGTLLRQSQEPNTVIQSMLLSGQDGRTPSLQQYKQPGVVARACGPSYWGG